MTIARVLLSHKFRAAEIPKRTKLQAKVTRQREGKTRLTVMGRDTSQE